MDEQQLHIHSRFLQAKYPCGTFVQKLSINGLNDLLHIFVSDIGFSEFVIVMINYEQQCVCFWVRASCHYSGRASLSLLATPRLWFKSLKKYEAHEVTNSLSVRMFCVLVAYKLSNILWVSGGVLSVSTSSMCLHLAICSHFFSKLLVLDPKIHPFAMRETFLVVLVLNVTWRWMYAVFRPPPQIFYSWLVINHQIAYAFASSPVFEFLGMGLPAASFTTDTSLNVRPPGNWPNLKLLFNKTKN